MSEKMPSKPPLSSEARALNEEIEASHREAKRLGKEIKALSQAEDAGTKENTERQLALEKEIKELNDRIDRLNSGEELVYKEEEEMG